MRLVRINPPLRPGQQVVCACCGRLTSNAAADMDGPPFTFADLDHVESGSYDPGRAVHTEALRRAFNLPPYVEEA